MQVGGLFPFSSSHFGASLAPWLHFTSLQQDIHTMPNKQIVFSDRLVGLSLQNGLVRLDLAVNAGTAKGKDDKPAQRMEITTQLVMPLDAFANAVAMQQSMLQQVMEQNNKLREAASAPATAQASA